MNLDEMSASDAILHYREIGRGDIADKIETINLQSNLTALQWPWNKEPEPWEHTNYAYGFIPRTAQTNSAPTIEIFDAAGIAADLALKNARITVSLDFLKIFDYPGKGNHKIMFEFNASNFVNGVNQDPKFTQLYEVQEGQSAAITGYPIFLGLHTGDEVVHFASRIVNVSNDDDEKISRALSSDTLKNGLKIINTINPAMPIITEYARAITEHFAARHRNTEIRSPIFSLWFNEAPGRINIAQGTYIALQNPDQNVDWAKYSFHKGTRRLTLKNDPTSAVPFNYFGFSVTKAAGV